MSGDWREREFGATLVKCDSCDAGAGVTGKLATVSTREALADCREDDDDEDGVVLGVYFSFANISAASDDFPVRLESVWRRVSPRLRLVEVVLWAHGDGAAGGGGDVGERERGYRAAIAGKPWLAVPFHDVHVKRRLTRKYKIAVGVPALVVRGRHVRDALLADPLALRFPWPPPRVADVLREVPLQHCVAASAAAADTLLYSRLPEDAVRVFYFAAHWCPPCRVFTPIVTAALAAVRRRRALHTPSGGGGGGGVPQLILVSSDRSEASYMRTVGAVSSGEGGAEALAVPWRSEEARHELATALGVAGIPALVLLDSRDAIITDAGRQALQADPDAWNFPWSSRPLSVLTAQALPQLSRHPAVLLFVEREDSEVEFGESVLGPAASAYRDECAMRRSTTALQNFSSDEDAQPSDCCEASPQTHDHPSRGRARFHVVVEGSEAAACVRACAGLDDALPLLVGVDPPRRRLCVMDYGAAITTHSVQNFVDAFLSGEAPCRHVPHLQRTLQHARF